MPTTRRKRGADEKLLPGLPEEKRRRSSKGTISGGSHARKPAAKKGKKVLYPLTSCIMKITHIMSLSKEARSKSASCCTCKRPPPAWGRATSFWSHFIKWPIFRATESMGTPWRTYNRSYQAARRMVWKRDRSRWGVRPMLCSSVYRLVVNIFVVVMSTAKLQDVTDASMRISCLPFSNKNCECTSRSSRNRRKESLHSILCLSHNNN